MCAAKSGANRHVCFGPKADIGSLWLLEVLARNMILIEIGKRNMRFLFRGTGTDLRDVLLTRIFHDIGAIV